MGGGLSIEPLIILLARRDRDVDDFELADGAVSAARSDVNSGHWFDVMAFAIAICPDSKKGRNDMRLVRECL